MATWDVFHSDRLEIERGLSTEAVRGALARGSLTGEDLIRPAGGASPWVRLADAPPLGPPGPEPGPTVVLPTRPEPPSEPGPEPGPGPSPSPDLGGEAEFFVIDDDGSGELAIIDGDDDDDEFDHDAGGETAPPTPLRLGPLAEGKIVPGPLPPAADAAGGFGLDPDDGDSSLEVAIWDDGLDDEFDPQDEDEAAAEFTLSRGAADRVEELDLAAMVDVAFQLVLFFLVTATTVLYKSLEVPKPNPESNQAAAAQGRKTLDDLQKDFILVEIDPAGTVKIDREPVPAERPAIVATLRRLRDESHRSSMLLQADFATPHKSAVAAYDAANEIGLAIAIARPAPPGSAAPGG